jgi:enoyl-CoA hydratase/3-hydroxyacyl-CoA dehydrogenase
MITQEATAFQELVFSDTCKSLVHVFFSQRATSKVWGSVFSSSFVCVFNMNIQCTDLSDMQQIPGATDLGLMPRKITKVAILGGGLMGSGIATTLILSNYPVILKEVNEKFLNAGIDRIKGNCFITNSQPLSSVRSEVVVFVWDHFSSS